MPKITITSKIEAEELRKALAEYDSKPVRWRPNYDEVYYFITATGKIRRDNWDNYEADIERWNSYNCFPTREMAESCLPDLLRARAYIMAARIVDPDFVPDWDDADQEKWTISYHNDGDIYWSCCDENSNVGVTHCSTRDKVMEMAELLKAWGVK